MNTRKNKTKIIKNKTMKNTKLLKSSLKILEIGYPLYASKQYEGNTILEYNKNEEIKYHDSCLMQNSSWFGDLDVAKSYKTKYTHIYRWNTKKITKLLNINKENENFIDNIFKNSNIKLVPSIVLTKKILENIKYEHSYLNMMTNERALYEFKFCFGYITVKEQYEFLKLLQYLLKNKIINMETRGGDSILKKIKMKIVYYNVGSLLGKKNKYNRLSFYDLDKHAVMNLCKLVNNTKYNISGVYQKNAKSFWFPNLLVYKMNIQEYILFNPHHNLVYDKLIE
jgi:hypothetical protein